MESFGDLLTDRQMIAVNTLGLLIAEVKEIAKVDSISAGLPDDGVPLREGGAGALAYAEAISVYLAFLCNQVANHQTSICGWNSANSQMRSTFGRQAIPMTWDFAERSEEHTSELQSLMRISYAVFCL